MDDRQLAASALALTHDQLLVELGAQLSGTSTSHLKDGELDDLQQRARNWLARNWEGLRSRICGHPAVTAVLGDQALELLAVADLIVEVWLQKPGAITVAAIICRFGLTRFCAGEHPEELN